MDDVAKCELCGEPMPPGETMFKFHGHSGPCPKEPLVPSYQSRVIAERSELEEKIAKLGTFLSGTLYAKLPQAEQLLLSEQYSVMTRYSSILSKRIEAFSA